jgi:hypothetical protein
MQRLSGDPPPLDRAEELGAYVADLVPALRHPAHPRFCPEKTN